MELATYRQREEKVIIKYSPYGTAGELLRLDYDVNSSLTGCHVIVLLHLNVIGLSSVKLENKEGLISLRVLNRSLKA